MEPQTDLQAHGEASAEAWIPPGREPATDRVDPRFPARWSPRAFSDDPVPEADLEALFEAARWAPSSYNEQPWRFVYATGAEDRARFLEALLPGNRAWAKDAPVLLFVAAKTTLERNGKPNRHAWFDTGAAWMSLALQARQLGLHTRAMGGIDPAKAAQVIGLPQDHEVICAVALGYRDLQPGSPEDPADRRPQTSDRKPLAEIAHEAGFPAP